MTMATPAQLHMIWPSGTRPHPDDLEPATGYEMRLASHDDVPSFRALMAAVELGTWDDDTLKDCLDTVVPAGWQVATHLQTGDVVATGMAQRKPVPDLYADGFEVGWIAAHPRHKGQRLGRAVTTAAVARLVESGATSIYLQTDDHRLPAIKTYLSIGFVPHLYQPDMPERWRRISQALAWPYQPTAWPRQPHVPVE